MTRDKELIKDFIRHCKEELSIQSLPAIRLINDGRWVEERRSFGEYSPSERSVTVYAGNRNTADVFRSLAHELTHHRQHELGMIEPDSGETGSDIENEANAFAGMIMREFGKINPNIYEVQTTVINEGRQVGTLYYFGPYRRLARLAANGFKLSSTIQPYVSFTRNKSMVSDTIANETRIAIDGDKLSNRYKIAPFAQTSAGYGRAGADEAEERIDLSKYPGGIDISKAIIGIEIKNPMSVTSTFDDEESFEPPSLEEYDKLLKILKAKNLDYKIVQEFK